MKPVPDRQIIDGTGILYERQITDETGKEKADNEILRTLVTLLQQ